MLLVRWLGAVAAGLFHGAEALFRSCERRLRELEGPDAGGFRGGEDEGLRGGRRLAEKGRVEGPDTLLAAGGEIVEHLQKGIELRGSGVGGLEANDDGVGPEQVGRLELAVALVADLGRAREEETAQADVGLGFHGANGNGKRELLGGLGVGLEEDE